MCSRMNITIFIGFALLAHAADMFSTNTYGAAIAEPDLTTSCVKTLVDTTVAHVPVSRKTQAATFLLAVQSVVCLGLVIALITRVRANRRAERQTQRRLLQASQQADMAQVAAGVLHNVGNVLNSVNVSASMSIDMIGQSRASRLRQAADMINEHRDDLATFLSSDDKGKLLPQYMSNLADLMDKEHTSVLTELRSLSDNVEHIRQIINTQQSYAARASLRDAVSIEQLVNDAVRINALAFHRHDIDWQVECDDMEPVLLDKHRVLQILINLISNAKHALSAADKRQRELRITVRQKREGRLEIAVSDNGIGIAPEDVERIFEHGVTRREGGHGFGLHSARLAAEQMGGELTASSEGLDKGARFTLELPIRNESDHEMSTQASSEALRD